MLIAMYDLGSMKVIVIENNAMRNTKLIDMICGQLQEFNSAASPNHTISLTTTRSKTWPRQPKKVPIRVTGNDFLEK